VTKSKMMQVFNSYLLYICAYVIHWFVLPVLVYCNYFNFISLQCFDTVDG